MRPTTTEQISVTDIEAGLSTAASFPVPDNDSSILFDLAPELRFTIYEYALSTEERTILRTPEERFLFTKPMRDYLRYPATKPFNNSLLMVSKQVHQEARPVFYKQNIFQNFVHTSYASYPPQMHGHFAHYLPLLQHVRIEFTDNIDGGYSSIILGASDSRIALRLEMVRLSCPRLRTILLHIVTPYGLSTILEEMTLHRKTVLELRMMADNLSDKRSCLERVEILFRQKRFTVEKLLCAFENRVWYDLIALSALSDPFIF